MRATALIQASAASLILGASAIQASDAPTRSEIDEAKGIIKEFVGRLQAELKTAIQEGGPVEAIGMCEERAPEIAAELSQSSGWDVDRTSLKVRNTERNSPDGWETSVLEQFEARKAEGEDLKTMAYSEVVDGPDGQQFRFMKAIPTQKVCLACHGEHIANVVAEALDAHYPEDQARGFSVGDIRGAFTLTKPLKP